MMKELKSLDYKLLYELMKNSRRSDRELARVLKISQPTVSRRRTELEKNLIDGYTAIPKWKMLGYEILAITLIKIPQAIAAKEKYNAVRKRGLEWLMSQPNVVMAGACRGMGVDSFMMSFHKSYSDYDNFMRKYRLELGDFMEDAQSVLVNLFGEDLLKPLNLRYLAEAK
jgi:DNA-binding Lrp family transcriptional regulator